MTIIYRETDPVSGRWTGNSSGIDLSAFQIDQNFYEAISRITTLESEVSTAISISYITISGDQLTFHMTDSTSQGPFTVPTATFVDRGAWSALTAYSVNDTFNINGTLYLVIFAHISAATFSAGANDGLGHNYYSALLSVPGNALPTGGAVGQVPVKSTTTDFAVTWGWKFPTGGTARQYLIKINGTQDNAEWDTPRASDIGFTPSTASALTATNVADAIEEAALSGGGGGALSHLSDVLFATGEPTVGSLLYFNGTKWIPLDSPDTGGVAWFNGSDWLTTSAPAASNYIPKWNGSAWIAAPLRDTTITALGTSGAVSLDASLGNVFTITPSGDVTINNSAIAPGAEITVIVTTSGTTSRTITLGSNFLSQGTLATGTVSGKTFVLKFIGDGGTHGLVEASRTTAM